MGLTRKEWIIAWGLLLIAITLVMVGYHDDVSNPDVLPGKIDDALRVCQRRISHLNGRSDHDIPPDAKNYGTYPEFYFVWPKGTFFSEADDGRRMPMSATCRGEIASGWITELSINGRRIK